jgi:NAD(P)-dependent dehydrogenase (short-subunit alcohol dehydrogenase family)
MVAKYGSPLLNPGTASSIILTGGTVSIKPARNWSVIAAWASSLHGMVKNLSVDLGVRVNLVTPGGVDTEMWDTLGFDQKMKEAWAKGFEKTTVTGRAGRVEDIVQAFLYCMKDENVVGATIMTEGGLSIMPRD